MSDKVRRLEWRDGQRVIHEEPSPRARMSAPASKIKRVLHRMGRLAEVETVAAQDPEALIEWQSAAEFGRLHTSSQMNGQFAWHKTPRSPLKQAYGPS